MDSIYLDHNADSPLRPEAVEALREFAKWTPAGNPSSVHRSGQHARQALESARRAIAALIGASPRQIIFTSGGTESNNLALLGATSVAAGSQRRRIVTSAIEHSSILAPVAELERRGLEVIRLYPDARGLLDPDDVVAHVNESTAIVALGLANSEVGTVQSLKAIGPLLARQGALLHVDAVQAAGRIPVDVSELGCDFMSLSGHKLGAPAGIGVLYVRDSVRINPVLFGGPQEQGLRPGSPNLAGALALGAVAESIADRLESENRRVASLTNALRLALASRIPGLRFNGHPEQCIPNTLNLTFPHVRGEDMLIALDLAGVEVSMGSACAAGAVEPSHVLLAMGRSQQDASSSLRISLGWSTTSEEVNRAAGIIADVWQRISQIEPGSAHMGELN